jgi:pilus assembly protein Flp/PilA
MSQLVARLRPPRSDRGATAVEYALLLSLIAVIIIVGIGALGTGTSAMLDKPCADLAAQGHPC